MDGKRSSKVAARRVSAKPKLFAGANPEFAKSDGDAPAQAHIAAMPGWKRDVGRRLDALIVRSVPGVRKAVKSSSPFYGIEGQGWFLGIHTFRSYRPLQRTRRKRRAAERESWRRGQRFKPSAV